MASRTRTLYTGVTNDLRRRVDQHRRRLIPGLTRRYNIDRLVFWEATEDVRSAIKREKQLKGWSRTRKIALIEAMNPDWRDLSEGWDLQ